MTKPNPPERAPAVDAILSQRKTWRAECERLRDLVLGCGLHETVKWRWPCYTLADNRNIVLIHAFKEYCALLFFKGALLPDPEGVLIQQTANVQAARQMRFTCVEQIATQQAVIQTHVHKAIEVEKAGQKVVLKTPAQHPVADEFQQALDGNPALQAAFHALTPGRQRLYLMHFASAKQAKTRLARVAQCVPDILAGRGLNEGRGR